MIMGCMSINANEENQDYEPQQWHQFLIYIGLTLGAFVVNAFGNSILPIIYRGVCTMVPA